MATLSVTFTIPDAKSQIVLDAVCAALGYNAASGQTKLAFFKSGLKEYVNQLVRTQLAQQYNQQAVESLRQDLASISIVES